MFKFFLLLLICCLTLSECERVFYFGDIVGKSLMTYQTMWKRRIKYPEHSEPYEFIVENSDIAPRDGIAYVKVIDLNDGIMPIMVEGGPGHTRMKMELVPVKQVMEYLIEVWTERYREGP